MSSCRFIIRMGKLKVLKLFINLRNRMNLNSEIDGDRKKIFKIIFIMHTSQLMFIQQYTSILLPYFNFSIFYFLNYEIKKCNTES